MGKITVEGALIITQFSQPNFDAWVIKTTGSAILRVHIFARSLYLYSFVVWILGTVSITYCFNRGCNIGWFWNHTECRLRSEISSEFCWWYSKCSLISVAPVMMTTHMNHFLRIFIWFLVASLVGYFCKSHFRVFFQRHLLKVPLRRNFRILFYSVYNFKHAYNHGELYFCQILTEKLF